MVQYILCCDDHHKVEAWFRSKADFERLAALGEVRCPQCEPKALEGPASDADANSASRADVEASAQFLKHPTAH